MKFVLQFSESKIMCLSNAFFSYDGKYKDV